MDSEQKNKSTINERGELIAAYCGNKEPIWAAILKYSVGMVIGFGLIYPAYVKGMGTGVILTCCIIGMIFVYLAWRMARRHKTPRVKVYEKGLWFAGKFGKAAKGFYTWGSVVKVEQQRYEENTSPTYRFLPGYCIRLKDGKQWWIKQTLDDYTGLYHLLYQYGVRNSQKPLYLFDVDIEGFQMKNEAWYSAVYYPDKGKRVKERGQPIVY